MSHIKILDDDSFGRDPVTKAIVNLNTESYLAHMKKMKNQEHINTRLEKIENDVKEIKDMFSTILSKLG